MTLLATLVRQARPQARSQMRCREDERPDPMRSFNGAIGFTSSTIGPLEPYRYSRDRVEELIFRNSEQSFELVTRCKDDLSPYDGCKDIWCIHTIRNRASAAEGGASGRRVLEMLCEAALAIRATQTSAADVLGLELDPNLHGETTDQRSAPYGVLYFYGRMFHGFHVRFRDIACGGLRVVRPRNAEAT